MGIPAENKVSQLWHRIQLNDLPTNYIFVMFKRILLEDRIVKFFSRPPPLPLFIYQLYNSSTLALFIAYYHPIQITLPDSHKSTSLIDLNIWIICISVPSYGTVKKTAESTIARPLSLTLPLMCRLTEITDCHVCVT